MIALDAIIEAMVSPEAARLTALRNGLLTLHKKLLDSQRAAYETDVGKVQGPGHLLNLVLNDPSFAWLRELSQLVVVIDEMLDGDEPITKTDAERLVAQTRSLLTASENGNPFQRSYDAAFQRDPDAIIAHSQMVKVLSSISS